MLGVICATDREFSLIKGECEKLDKKTYFQCDYFSGTLSDHKMDVVITKCGVGKVASALTVSVLKLQYKCQNIIFIGTAGALTDKTQPGDVVISTGSVQHDFDGRPFIEKCTVFSVGEKIIKSCDKLQKVCKTAAQNFLAQNPINNDARDKFGLPDFSKVKPESHIFSGVIASGDQFINSPAARKRVLNDVPEALCCEMEGAAVAQACHVGGIAHCIVRVISDKADNSAAIDFNAFCDQVAGVLTHGILKCIITEMKR